MQYSLSEKCNNLQMCQTPLHVAAGYNNTEIVKFLLNQQGTETVDLEAKNMVLKLPHFFCI